ncbi:MAG: hypothetical protein WEA56_02955 [Balneolaceae bacterium]
MTKNSDSFTKKSLLGQTIELAGVGAVLYVLGFVIANVHLAKYGLVRWTIIEGRYIGAGLLFIVIHLLPFVAGYTGWQQFRGRPEGFSVLRVWIEVVVLVSLSIILSLALVNFVTVSTDHIYWTWPTLFALIAYGAGLITPWLLSTNASRRIGQFKGTVKMYAGAGVACALLILAALFGSTTFAYISPAWGGGGAMYGIITLKEGSLPDRNELTRPTVVMHYPSPVLLIERSEHFLTIVRCVQAPDNIMRGLARPGEIPISEVARIDIGQSAASPHEIEVWREEGCPIRIVEKDWYYAKP